MNINSDKSKSGLAKIWFIILINLVYCLSPVANCCSVHLLWCASSCLCPHHSVANHKTKQMSLSERLVQFSKVSVWLIQVLWLPWTESLLSVLTVCKLPAVKHEWQKLEKGKSLQNRGSTFPAPRFRCVVTPLLQQWHSRSAAALPITGSLSAFSLLFFLFQSVSSFFFPLPLFLFVSWLTEWVSRRLCCVVFDSSLGAKLSLTQLLGPTVFLKSVSINIIMAYSRRHWIFYCNVQQNITPTLNATQRKSSCLTETFYFDWKVFVWSVSSVKVFVFLLCFPFCALGKVLGLCLIKCLKVFFFLSGIYYWHFPGIGLGAQRVGVLYLIVQSSSQEKPCCSVLQAKQFGTRCSS